VKLDEANNEVDKFCIQQAKFIKNLLSSSGGQNPYNTYNKGTFRDACKRIGSSAQAIRALLTTEQKSTFTAKKEGQPKSSLSLVAFTFPDLKKSRDMAVELLRETVVSTAINDLVNNPELGSWVETGLALHSKEHKRTHCGFCGTSLPENRLYELEAHFNDTYKQFTAKLDKAVRDLHIQKRSLELLVVPDKSQIYEHLAERISAASQKLSTFSIEVRNYLDALAQSLEQKRDRVFEACKLEPSVVEPDCSIANPWISEINELIRQHNQQTDDFEGSVRDARTRLEEHYVAEAYEEFSAKEKVAEQLSSELRMLKPAAVPIQAEITRLEKTIVEHRQPAEELNAELASYLGRNDLQLEVSETGYSLVRDTQPATNLSEGEKTAFAFLYFLKGLQDKGFDLNKGIVVIDDPISSLDSNSLFSAFGFMKERAKEAGQLFIFTHSFGFFRQVKNWFNNLENQKKKDLSRRPARFYMLDPVHDGTIRKSTIKALDPLLHEYESEYHYLFKKLYAESQVDKKSTLAVYYGLPNMARRLLESFLAFRYPSLAGNLVKQIEQVHFDPARRARLLRFTHTHSHDPHVPEPEHDLSILSETPVILKDLFDLIAAEDRGHFDEMLKVVVPVPEEEIAVAARP